MTTYLSRLKSLYVKAESTFNVSGFSGNPTNSDRLEAEDLVWTPTQELIERPVQLDSLGSIGGVVGGKGGTISFKVGLRSSGTGNGHSASQPQSVGGALAVALVGAGLQRLSQQGGQLDASAPGTSTTVKLQSAGHFGVGNSGAPLVGIGGAGALQARLIPASASGVTQTVAPPLLSTPSPYQLPQASGDAWAADVFWPNSDASTPATVTFVAQGNGYQFTFTGCAAPPPKLSGQAGQRAMLQFAFQVSSWSVSSLTAPSPDSFSSIQAGILALGSPFFWKAASTSPTPIADFTFDFGVTPAPLKTTQSSDGKAGWIPTALTPKLTIKPYFDAQWASDFAAATVDVALLQVGTNAGSAIAIALPYAQITKYPAATDLSGLVGHQVELTGRASSSGGPLMPAYLAFY